MNTIEKDVVFLLAKNIVNTKYEDLPIEAVAAGKKSILDTLGVITGASGIVPEIKGLVEFVKEAGGKKESTILGFGGKVPAWMAAFANGAMAHGLDYDDAYHYGRGHPSATTIPSGFAIAERIGKVDGKGFITAIALGNDLFCRLNKSVGITLWHPTALFGVFSAAATSGKLLNLDVDKMTDALGHAFFQAAGTGQLRRGTGSNFGGIRDAFSNKSGVLAALLAQMGINGVKESFEGEAGLYNVYFGGKYNRDALTNDLGKSFEGAKVGYKPWPSCVTTHGYIDATLSLVTKNDINPEDIEEITVFVGDPLSQNLCTPLEGRRRPITMLDAKFSIPFAVAAAIAKKEVVIQSFSMEGINDPIILRVAQKIVPKMEIPFKYDPKRIPRIVEIKMKNGRTYSERVDVPYGHPERPLTWPDLVMKFKDCLKYSAKRVPPRNTEKVIDMISDLEDVGDVGKIIALFSC